MPKNDLTARAETALDHDFAAAELKAERERWHFLVGQTLTLSTKDAQLAGLKSLYEMTGE